MKYYDIFIKEFLSDLIVEGVINILKSGFNNPISTFFTNVLIIEGPLKLKEELFAAFYEYIDSTAELNNVMIYLINTLIAMTFDSKENKHIGDKFIKEKSTTLAFFLYDIIIVHADDNDIYLSAYDFVQPDSNMINSPESMDPLYISENFKKALELDLNKFKKI